MAGVNPGLSWPRRGPFKEFVMRPSSRRRVSKRASARKFRSNVARTKAANVSPGPMRGGIRL